MANNHDPRPGKASKEHATPGLLSIVLSHPSWAGVGGLVALLGVLSIYPLSDWSSSQADAVESPSIEQARQKLHSLGISKAQLRDVMQHIAFEPIPHTSNEQTKFMMQFVGAHTILAKSSGGDDATTGNFGAVGSNSLQYGITI